MVFSYLYEDPNGILSLDINLYDAVILHTLCVVTFAFSYLVTDYGKLNIKSDYTYAVKNLTVCYFIAFFGVIVVVAQVLQSGSLVAHFASLISDTGGNSREAFLLESRNGGLPGYIKIFANAPLAIYLFTFSLYSCINLDEQSLKKIKRLLYFSIFCVLLKTLFSLDRLSLLAITLTFFYFVGVRGLKVSSILITGLVILLANFISGVRMSGYTLLDFLLLYMKLGLINLQLVINGNHDLTYGFQTFFHFITYFDQTIFNFFELEFQKYEWIWNPALYFVSYGFLDFGYAVIFIYFLLGVFSSKLDRSITTGKAGFMQVTYFVFLYSFASFFTVPAIRGVEFVLAILICSVMAKFTIIKLENK